MYERSMLIVGLSVAKLDAETWLILLPAKAPAEAVGMTNPSAAGKRVTRPHRRALTIILDRALKGRRRRRSNRRRVNRTCHESTRVHEVVETCEALSGPGYTLTFFRQRLRESLQGIQPRPSTDALHRASDSACAHGRQQYESVLIGFKVFH